GGQVQTIDDVVETRFEQPEERGAGLTLAPGGLSEIVLELTLQHAVDAPHLLLLAKLASVLRYFRAVLDVRFLSRSRRAPFDRALLGQASFAFQEELDLFARL